mgnify:FL=1
MIKHSNIIYLNYINEIGGVETFVYEMVKKYKDLDIAVVYKQGNNKQLERLKKYCRCYKHTNEEIECDVAIINYDISIIDFINENAKIYQVVHGDYENKAYTMTPPTHERIYKYITITNYLFDSFKKITKKENVIMSYNPLTLENNKKLVLFSATRLSPIKGKLRMIRLANELDKQGIDYIWYIFTNDDKEISNENVVYMKPRLDISYWLKQADYLVQLSDTEACSYSINEALYRNIPVIVTPLPYLKEIGVENGKNAYILEFDCSNIEDVVKNIQNIPKFEFKKLEDKYKDLLKESKSHYEEDKKMKVKVKCVLKGGYDDIKLKRHIDENEEYIVDFERANYLKDNNAVEILEEIKEEKKDKFKKEESKKLNNKKVAKK